ncbi:MAG: Hydroxyacylglutathione hydrolase [Methanomassiliicoccales archaeon PtaU1.Bin124]|nr:MAG: Hydroxyacylglutathione hydrolase [Methanomassiliicoccales archaeon PtaU1.Bin124]
MVAGKHYFIAKMPDEPGALHRAAEIVKRYKGNIERIHYDRRIDPYVVFFEVTCTEREYDSLTEELKAIGYLQTALNKLGFLKFNVYLPNRSGALFEFLNFTTNAKCNIAFLDFDDKSPRPERLTVSLTIDDISKVDGLLEQLKSRYPLEILEYDTTGRNLDDTVFYIRFAQQLREIVGEKEDEFLMKLLSDVNHIVQELTNLNIDPKQVFQSVLETGKALRDTAGAGFYADVQQFRISNHLDLYAFQMPCGGNIFVLKAPDEMVMIDTGYGSYHEDLAHMLAHYGLGDLSKLKAIYLTHADADHAGGAGLFPVPSHASTGTVKIIESSNRAYGSVSESSVLEEVYTKLINLFSRFSPPGNIREMRGVSDKVGGFDAIGLFRVGDVDFLVLEGLGGHQHGHVYFLSEGHGLMFTGDSLINFHSLSEDRKKYNILAKNLMTSVNVDSEKAEEERKMLMDMARSLDVKMVKKGRRCLVCGGHGAVSVLEGDRLTVNGEQVRFEGEMKG